MTDRKEATPAHDPGAKPRPGRPEEMTAGKRHNIYLDAASWAIAVKVGQGNASAGIRDALAQLREGK